MTERTRDGVLGLIGRFANKLVNAMRLEDNTRTEPVQEEEQPVVALQEDFSLTEEAPEATLEVEPEADLTEPVLVEDPAPEAEQEDEKSETEEVQEEVEAAIELPETFSNEDPEPEVEETQPETVPESEIVMTEEPEADLTEPVLVEDPAPEAEQEDEEPETEEVQEEPVTYYTSTRGRGKFYYTSNCPELVRELHEDYLAKFDSLDDLLAEYPNRTLSPRCQ